MTEETSSRDNTPADVLASVIEWTMRPGYRSPADRFGALNYSVSKKHGLAPKRMRQRNHERKQRNDK